MRRDRVGMAAGVFLVLVVLAAVPGAPLAAHLTGHGPNQQFGHGLTTSGIPLGPLSHEVLDNGKQDPHGQFFLLGTDTLGRDVFVRLLYGARISLLVAVGATGLAVLIGTVLGLIAGYFRGPADIVISRAIEAIMAFPSLLFGVGLAAVLGPGLINSIVVIALFTWYYPARVVRSTVLSLRTREFVQAAISMGVRDTRVMARHLLPHVTAPLIVYATSAVALNIIFAAGLSYLGLGVAPPTADWGQMLSDGVTNGLYRVQPWTAVIPGAALALATLALNQFGDALRDALAVGSNG